MASARVQFTPEAWETWRAWSAAVPVSRVRLGDAPPTRDPAVSGLAHTSALVQFGALLDACIDPAGILVREGGAEGGPFVPRFPTAVDGGETLPLIGSRATDAALRAMRDRTGGDDLAREQRAYVGALAALITGMGRGRVVSSERGGGALLLAIPVGYYVVAGIVSLGIVAAAAVATWIAESADTARRSEVLSGAGADYVARLAAFRQTQVMPPPSERERAARAAIDADANNFWGSFGRGLGDAARTGSKGLVLGGLLLGLIYLSQQKASS